MRSWVLVIIAILVAGELHAQTGRDKPEMLSDRPDPDGVPTVVVVNTFISDVITINNVDQSFRVDLYFTVTWKDPRLAGASRRNLPLADIWHPNLTILDERNLKELLPWVVTVEKNGEVTLIQRLIGDLSARMDLHEFPYDHQTLSVQLISLDYTPEEIRLQPKTASTQGFAEFSVSGWRLTLGKAYAEPLVIPSTEERLAQIIYEIDSERDVAYYRWTMSLPLALIVLMAWMVFWIDPSLVASQIGLSTASIFSLIAFRFSMRMALPAVSYMTRMDEFLLGCTVLVFMALGQAVVTGRLAKDNRESTAQTLDRWGRWIYLGVFVLLVIFYL